MVVSPGERCPRGVCYDFTSYVYNDYETLVSLEEGIQSTLT